MSATLTRPKARKRRKGRPYTAEDCAQILAAMAQDPPPTWGQLGKLLDRHPMGVRDKWRMLTGQRIEERYQGPGILKPWPAWAIFGPVKSIPSQATPISAPVPGAGPGGRQVESPFAPAGQTSEAAP